MPQQDKIDLMKRFTARIELKLTFPQQKLSTKEDTVTQVEPDISATQTDSHTAAAQKHTGGLRRALVAC